MSKTIRHRRTVQPLRAALAGLCLLGAASARADVAPCQLNSPVPGESPSGLASAVFSPAPFDGFDVTGEGFAFFEGYEGDGYVVVFNEQTWDPESPPSPVVLQFSQAGQVVHSCTVRTVDPTQRPQDWSFGDCATTRVAGPEVLRPGEYQLLRLPRPVLEASTAPAFADRSRNGIDMAQFSDQVLALFARRPGPGVLVSLHDTANGGERVSICPIVVAEADPETQRDETPLCRDREGKPLRLKPGQTAEATAGFVLSSALLPTPDVAEIVSVGEIAVTVGAKAAGTARLLLVSPRQDEMAEYCAVVVE